MRHTHSSPTLYIYIYIFTVQCHWITWHSCDTASAYSFISLHKMQEDNKFNSLLFGPLCVLYDQMPLFYGIMYLTTFPFGLSNLFCVEVAVRNENEHYRDRIFMNERNKINAVATLACLTLCLKTAVRNYNFFRERCHWKHDWFCHHFYLPLFLLINFTFLSNFHFSDKSLQFLISLHSALFYMLTAAMLTNSLTVLYIYMNNVSKITHFSKVFVVGWNILETSGGKRLSFK